MSTLEERLAVPRLSPAEIKQRLDKFNEDYDWSVFDDVPEIQHVEIMYPHYIKFNPIFDKVEK